MDFTDNPDRDWEVWGKTDPYFAVLTDPKFSDANLNDDSLLEFFACGERHIEHIYSVIRGNVRPDFQPARVLDYGCGVGRLVLPLAKRSETVVGVDISPSMLERARENCERHGVVSARLLHFGELDSLEPATFDLIHSCLVFQHIPVDRGELILRRLIDLLAEGGVGAIHLTYLTYHDNRSAFQRGLTIVRQRVRLVHGLLNLIRHRPLSTPPMQMNSYSMNRIFDILIDGHCSKLHVEFLDHGSAMLYFEKLHRPIP
jgi:SAM-dependent methyltransferase